ncbi:uncharacterized protein LOC143350587 [Colletes latitarsis]|uniref:uncharacterized protein LOC143350587 n=1 Tax=Colletes latitarsis TaxID=2605962 RepID=UPI0040352A22
MKYIGLALTLLCVIAYTAAQQEQLGDEEESYISERNRREADPQGSLVIQGTKPLDGPDRRPSLDVDYHNRVFDRNGGALSTYGGLNIRPGQSPQPHAGLQYERNFNNGFIRGHGQVQRGPGGGLSPSVGMSGGFRFRREADPQGSLVIQGTKPLDGPDRRPSLDVDYHNRVFDRNGGALSTYGGLNIRPGQSPQPHAGVHYEREFNNGFIRGHGQVQRGPGGGLSPSVGMSGGFRFRREADPQGSLVIQGTKPLDGPDRRPSLDVDYHNRVFDRNGGALSTYGGLNIRPGQSPQPHAGVHYEREFNNGFIRGHGQVQRGPGGGLSPSVGMSGGFRFRREADPQGSLVIQGTKPLDGPDRRPSLDVDYHNRVFDRNGGALSTYGGLNIRPGESPQPHAGLQYEREFNNGFIRGHGQVQRGPGGEASPSFGLSGGFRFRRETEPQGSLDIQVTKPMDGPDRRPSVDVDYHNRVFDKNGGALSTYGGLNIRPGESPQPHAGLQYEREFNNGFIRGHGQVQRGPGGGASPSFGLSAGFRFRRDVDSVEGEEE